MVDLEIIEKFNELKINVNKVKECDCMLPSDVGSIELLIQWIVYFVNPTLEDIEALVTSYKVELDEPQKEAIYPQIIDFILFVKKKFLVCV